MYKFNFLLFCDIYARGILFKGFQDETLQTIKANVLSFFSTYGAV